MIPAVYFLLFYWVERHHRRLRPGRAAPLFLAGRTLRPARWILKEFRQPLLARSSSASDPSWHVGCSIASPSSALRTFDGYHQPFFDRPILPWLSTSRRQHRPSPPAARTASDPFRGGPAASQTGVIYKVASYALTVGTIVGMMRRGIQLGTNRSANGCWPNAGSIFSAWLSACLPAVPSSRCRRHEARKSVS